MSRFLAIDADFGAVHVASGTIRAGLARLEKAISVPVREMLTPANAVDLGHQVRDALKSAGIAPAPTLATVGRDKVIVKDVKIPSVTPAEEPGVVRFQASKEMSESPDSIVLDYFTLDRPDPDGQIRVVTASVRKELLAAYKALCQAAGLKLVGFTPRPLSAVAALDRAIAAGAVTAAENKRSSVAILTRGEKWGELVIARDGQVVFARAITATALNSEPMLLGELRRNLAVYNGQNPQQPVEAVYVAEAAGPSGGWYGRVAAGLSVPVQAFDPLAGVDHHTAPEARGHFAALAGLIQLKAKNAPLPIDFVSPRQAVNRDAAKRRMFSTVAAVAALLIIGGLGFGYMRVQAKTTELTKLVKQKNDLDKLLKEMEEDKKRMAALKEWDDSRINWLDEMYDLAYAFPDISKIHLEQFRVDPIALQKNVKGKQNVAKMTLKIQTEDAKYMDALQVAITRDKSFHKVAKNIKPTPGGIRGGFLAYEVTAEVEKRPANEYTRKLNASPPAKKARKGDAGDFGFDNFGGFGGPGQ